MAKWDNLRIARDRCKPCSHVYHLPFALQILCSEIRQLKNDVKRLKLKIK